MSSFSYNITISTYNKLLNSLDVLYAVNAIILGYTTEGLKLINANTVRFTFENNAELDGGGLYAIRCLIDDDNNVNNKKNNIYVGIACILKNECKCETMMANLCKCVCKCVQMYANVNMFTNVCKCENVCKCVQI